MTAMYNFYSCVQKDGQKFVEWKMELCEKLRHCSFTTSRLTMKLQDRALRHMFAIDIRSEKLRQALRKNKIQTSKSKYPKRNMIFIGKNRYDNN